MNSFNKLKLDVVIKVNNRKLLKGILEQAGIKKKEEAIISIDKLDKIGEKGVTKELLNRGYKKSQIKKVDDKVTQIKLTEVMNQIDGLKKGKVVSDKQVVSMMRYYQLIGEIDNVAN